MEAFKLEFGKHGGSTLGQVAKIDPSYVLWLSGTATKYTFSQAFQEVKRDHPDAIEAVRGYVKDMCLHCFMKKDAKHRNCSMSGTTRYNFHPYGGR